MSSYKGQNLFGSGPHVFVVHGLGQRHQRHESPGADGLGVTVLGRTGRSIEQTGTLLADDVDRLDHQTAVIEGVMDGQAGDLVDHLGRGWPDVLMLEFKPGGVYRVGVRMAVDYRVSYLQVRPERAVDG